MPKKTFLRLPPEKQQRILAAAAEEFIKYKDDYEKSSISRIAEAADIGTGTMYKYFENKNDLFFYLFNQHKESPRDFTGADSLYDYSLAEAELESRLTDTGKILAEIIFKNNTLFQDLVFQENCSDEYFEEISAYLSRDRSRGMVRDEFSDDLIAYMYTGLEFIAYRYCLARGIDYSQDTEVFKSMTRLFFFGLYKDGSKGGDGRKGGDGGDDGSSPAHWRDDDGEQ